MKDLVSDTLSMIESRLSQARESKQVSISSGDIELMQSKELIFLILYHLLENVYKYTPEDAGLQVLIKSETKNLIEITVIDEGKGIRHPEKICAWNKWKRQDNGCWNWTHTCKGNFRILRRWLRNPKRERHWIKIHSNNSGIKHEKIFNLF